MSVKTTTFVFAIVLGIPLFAQAQAVTAPVLTLTLSKSSMSASANPAYSTLPTISWNSLDAVSCVASGSGWSGTTTLSGSQKINPAVTTTYIMTCTNAGGSTTKNVTLTVLPAANLQTASALSGLQQARNQSQAGTAGVSAPSNFTYTWNRNLQIGSVYAADVSALQTALTRAGVYAGEVTGGFYSKTFAAVKEFQRSNGIETTGFVGPQTRARLNALFGN